MRKSDQFCIKRILQVIYLLVIALYIAAIITLNSGERIYSDFDTAYYWFNELIKSIAIIQNILMCIWFMSEKLLKNDKSKGEFLK